MRRVSCRFGVGRLEYILMVIIGGLSWTQESQAQVVPIIDSLAIIGIDSVSSVDRDGVYGPEQNVIFQLIYHGVVSTDMVRGALRIAPQTIVADTTTWVYFGGGSRREPIGKKWEDSLTTLSLDSLGTSVLNDGGFVQLTLETSKTDLFQVFADTSVDDTSIALAGSKPSPVMNMRPTAIEADGDSLWVAGVFPGGDQGEPPQGFLALRNATGDWRRIKEGKMQGGEVLQFSGMTITEIAVSTQDVWCGTVNSGLLRYHKADDTWFQYTSEMDSLAGNEIGVPVVAVEDPTTVWVGVKDSQGGKGLKRVQLQGEGITVTSFGGLPLNLQPFPSTEVVASLDTTLFPDFTRILRVGSLTAKNLVGEDMILVPSFPDTLRIPNPRNKWDDAVNIPITGKVKARDSKGVEVQVAIKSQKVTVNVGGSPVVVEFPPEISFPVDSSDGIPDSVDIRLPEPQSFVVGIDYRAIFLEPRGKLQLPGTPDTIIQFPQKVTIQAKSADTQDEISALIFAEKGRINLVYQQGDKDTTLAVSLAGQGKRIANPARDPTTDPSDYVIAPLPDSVLGTSTEGTITVSLKETRIPVGTRLLGLPSLLRYRRADIGVPDSLFFPFPKIERIPNPGLVGEPDFRIAFFQPPEANVISAIAIDSTGDKWVGTGGSGLARLRLLDSTTPSWSVLPLSEGRLRSAIVFNLHVEDAAAGRYLWAGTDGGLVRLEISASAVDAVLSDTALLSNLRGAVDTLALADAYGEWKKLFSPSQMSSSVSDPTNMDAARGRATSTFDAAQASFKGLLDHVRVFSTDNSPIPDNMIRGMALSGRSKWVATPKGMAVLDDDRTGSLHHWRRYTAQDYGGIRDSLTAIEAQGGAIWIGRLPTWYSSIPWNLRSGVGLWAAMPLTLERLRTKAYFTGNLGKPQDLKGSFILDRERPEVRGLGILVGKASPEAARVDTLDMPGETEISATILDGKFGQKGIGSIRVYINPQDTLRPELTKLVSSSLFRFGEGVSQKVYSSPEDSLIKVTWIPGTPLVVTDANGKATTFTGARVENDRIVAGAVSYPIVGDTSLTNGKTAHIAVTDTTEIWRLRRHNFSFTPSALMLNAISNNVVLLEAIDRAGNKTIEKLEFYVRDISGTPLAVPVFVNYPNPLGNNGPTFFYYVLNGSGEKQVNLRIFDLSGVLVNILVRNESRAAGVYREIWDGRDFFGQPLANGVYLCELAVGAEKRYTKAAIFR